MSAAQRLGVQIAPDRRPNIFRIIVSPEARASLPTVIAAALPITKTGHWFISFISPTPEGAEYLGRNHRFVATLAQFLMEEALTKGAAARASRCGAMRTRAVSRLTNLYLLRLRFLIEQPDRTPVLAEEVLVVGHTGTADKPVWLAGDEVLTLLEPTVAIWWLWHWTGDAPCVILLVKITHECAIGDFQSLRFLEPTAETHCRPVVAIGKLWIINHWQDLLGHCLGGHQARTSGFRTIGDAIDTCLVEALDPYLQTTLRDMRVSQSEFKSSTAKQQVNGIESFLCLLVGATSNSHPQLFHGAGFRVGVLTRATDASIQIGVQKSTTTKFNFYARTFGKRSIDQPATEMFRNSTLF